MRIWELEDNKAIPSNLVLEQDFIMRIRRWHRVSAPQMVVNLIISVFDTAQNGRGTIEEVHQRLQQFIAAKKGEMAAMSNGDVFLSWPENSASKSLPIEAMAVVLPHGATDIQINKGCVVYHLPGDYAALRERANHYVEASRQAVEFGGGGISAAQLLHSDAARGPLTAWSVDQIGRLMQDVDMRSYVRHQTVFQHQANGNWQPLLNEYYVSFDELRRNHFPRLDVAAPEHLFLELCQSFDRRLLALLTDDYATIAGRAINLNISVASVMGPVFTQFARKVPMVDRGKIGFELHRGDLLQDFSLTLNAMMLLHRENFKVAIDSVTPDMLSYLNLALFEADYIKLNVSKERLPQLNEPAARNALAQIPREKLIFFRCDSEAAITTGLELGVSKFQGWLIDKKATK